MRKLFSIFTAILLTASIFGQSPEKMSYQAIIRNSSDQLVTNQYIGIQISILQGSVEGYAVYVETQTPTTNPNGLVSIEIGNGTVKSGNFSIIDWANGPYFIKTEIDPAGGTSYTITGTSQLLSVPYALHAKTAENVTGTISETDPVYNSSIAAGITGTDTTNWNNKQDQLTAGTGISIVGNTINVTGGGNSTHYVGELYGGGIVFWVDETGEHGLIASLNDLDGGSGVAWSATDDVEIGVSAQSLYDGVSNTVAIVAQDNTSGYAATLCDNYSNNGFSDWYLPSNQELRCLESSSLIIYNVLANDGDPNTNGLNTSRKSPYDYYWSSSECNYYYAWTLRLRTGNMDDYCKYLTCRVRAVRAF